MNAPERIWLQVGGDESSDEEYPESPDGVTWSWKCVFGNDIEYVLAANHPAEQLYSLDPRVHEILDGLFECEYGTVMDTDEYSDGALTDDGKYLRAWLDSQSQQLVPDDVQEAIEMAFEALFNQQCDSRDHGCMDLYLDAHKAWADWLGSPPAAPKPNWLPAIQIERAYQDRKWGTIEENPHNLVDWLCLIREECAEAAIEAINDNANEALVEIIQIAATCIACLEQHGIVERPPEDRQ